jgi:probable HAF family extracellular repeat protein
MVDLGTLPGGSFSAASAINDRGQVVGVSYVAGLCCYAFLWDAVNGMIDLGLPLGGINSAAAAVNNAGLVVGSYIPAFGPFPRAALWTSRGGWQDLDLPQAGLAGVNIQGHAVGSSQCLPTCNDYVFSHAFLWDRYHGARDLGTLPGQIGSEGNALNIHDQVVGHSGTFNAGGLPDAPGAFLWTKLTGMLNLNNLIDSSSGWQLYTTVGINAKGQITGWGTLNGEEHGFLLTVVPRRQ